MAKAVVKLSDLALLHLGCLLAWEDEEIGDTHPSKTMQDQLAALEKHVPVDIAAIENGLYYCNMLRERGEFPKTYKTFDELRTSLEYYAGRKFNLDLNLLEE